MARKHRRSKQQSLSPSTSPNTPIGADEKTDVQPLEDKHVKEALRSVVLEILNEETDNSHVVEFQSSRTVTFSSGGPIPPDFARAWAALDKDAPAAFIRMQEREQKFRHRRTYFGMSNGILIALASLPAAYIFAVYAKNPYLAGLALMMGIGSPNIGPLVKYLIDNVPTPQLSWNRRKKMSADEPPAAD